jgi:hypothetical protein
MLSVASSLGITGTTNVTFSCWINVTTAPTSGQQQDFLFHMLGDSNGNGILIIFHRSIINILP